MLVWQTNHGCQGLEDLLRQISYLWREEREKLLDSSEKVTSVLKQSRTAESGEPGKSILHYGYRLLLQSFDSQFGGFGAASKFPTQNVEWYLCENGVL